MFQKAFEFTQINVNKIVIDEIHYIKDNTTELYPYIVAGNFNKNCIKAKVASPLHGRSLICSFNSIKERFTITKGNGLTYFPFGFVSTEELEDYAWGYLRKTDAIRDYNSGEFIHNLGVHTNIMEAVYTLEPQLFKFSNKSVEIQPTILQYNVTCPYRISDIPFLSNKVVIHFTSKWPEFFKISYKEKHCIAAEVLLKNIRIMHENDVLHNAIHSQNYTLSLELLDFELSRTPVTPYVNVYDELAYKKLQKREIIQSLEIVNHIALFFKEKVNSRLLRQIMIKNGFENYLYPS